MRILSPKEAMDSLLKLQDDKPDQLVLKTLMLTGMRSTELITLRAQDIDANGGNVKVTACKGSRDRIIPVPVDFARALKAHMDKHGAILGYWTHSVSAASLTARLRDVMARNLSLFPAGTHCHSLRAAFAILVYMQTKDILMIKDLLGHKALSSTEIYVRQANTFIRRPEVLKAFKT